MPIAPLLETIGGFDGFGPSAVHLQSGATDALDLARYRKDVRQKLREHCPQEPGVYGLVDKRARLIYVGYSSRLRKRLLSYFTGRRRGQKEHRIARHAVRVHWEVVGHDFPAQLRELELIQRFAPDFNVKGRRHSREPGFVYLTEADAPQFKFSIRVPSTARRVWGPLPNYKSLRHAIEQLNFVLKLRDCPNNVRMRFAEQAKLIEQTQEPQCLRGEVGTCLAPCAGACTRRQYHTQVRRGASLLDGDATAVLTDIETKMHAASTSMQFERAGRLRDALEVITELRRQVDLLRNPPEPREGIYVVSSDDETLWYLLGGGMLWGMTRAPSTRDEARLTLDRIRRIKVGATDDLTAITRDSRRLLRSWFRNRPEELQRVQPLEQAGEHCKELLKPRSRRPKARKKAAVGV